MSSKKELAPDPATALTLALEAVRLAVGKAFPLSDGAAVVVRPAPGLPFVAVPLIAGRLPFVTVEHDFTDADHAMVGSETVFAFNPR